jgi:nitrogen regulatory protein PII
MKERSVFIRTDNLTQMTEILRKHNAGGISFYEINGAGRGKRDAIQEIVEAYTTGHIRQGDQSLQTMKREQKMKQLYLIGGLSASKQSWRFLRIDTSNVRQVN